jgi:hypothetical protein
MKPEHIWDPPTRIERLGLLALSVGVAVVFIIATILSPDKRGYGTHEQMGLRPCEFKALTGLNCPHCGMTTSFTHIVRGQFVESWNANPSGLLLAPLSLCAMIWSGIVAVTGRWYWTNEPMRYFIFGGIAYLIAAILIWVISFF